MSRSFYCKNKDVFTKQERRKMKDYFKRGISSGIQIKKIRDGLWELRLNDKKRALYTLVEIKGESKPYILEYIPDHKINRSLLVQDPGTLNRAQERAQADAIALEAKENEARLIQEVLDELKEAKLRPATFYQNQFVALDSFQKQALQEDLPAVLSGVAGSGKSLVALKFIEKCINGSDTESDIESDTESDTQPDTKPDTESDTQPDTKPDTESDTGSDTQPDKKPDTVSDTKPYTQPEIRRRVLYLTKSEALKQQIQENWNNSFASLKTQHTVDFYSLEYFVEDALKKGLGLADDSYFQEFCQSYFSFQNKNKNISTQITIDAQKIREEFLVCSGYDTLEAYKALGVKQSTVTDEQRETYYAAYQAYLNKLTADKRVDPDFLAIDLYDGEYDLILMDEAQDLSPYLINSLHPKAKNQQILYCMDTNQRLNSCKSILPFIFKKIKADPNDPKKHRQLTSTHRCPLKVVNGANKILAFENKLVKSSEKYKTSNIQAVSGKKEMGSLYVCDEKSLLDLDWMKASKQAYFVVITSKKNCEDPKILESIKKRFNADRVLTPEQAKGLEYEVVLAYDLFDKKLFNSFKKQISSLNKNPEESKPSNSDSKDAAHQNLAKFIHQTYTTYTRAKTALIICEEETHINKILLDDLKNGADSGLPPEDLFSKKSTKEDWEKEVIAQLGVKNFDLARDAFYKHLELDKDKQEEAYDKFINDLREKERAKEVKEVKKDPLPPTLMSRNVPPPIKNNEVVNLGVELKHSPLESAERESLPEVKPLIIHTSEKVPPPKKSLTQLFEERLFVPEFDSAVAKILTHLVKLVPGKKTVLHKIIRTKEDGKTENFLEFIEAHPLYKEQFLKCIANNLLFIEKIDFTDAKQSPWTELKEIQKFFSDYPITYLYSSPAHKLLRTGYAHASKMKAEANHISHLKKLVMLGADLDQIEEEIEYNQLIHLAVLTNDIPALKFFHKKGIKLEKTRPDGNTIVHLAAIEGNKDVFESLSDFNCTNLLHQFNACGQTPLHLLAQKNNTGILKTLINSTKKLDTPTQARITRPSHTAAAHGNLEVLKLFFEHQIALDLEDDQGYTPLVLSVLNRHTEVSAYLIEQLRFSDPSYYLSAKEASSILANSNSYYSMGLTSQIRYLIRTQQLRRSLTLDAQADEEVPINLAQLALAKGDKQTALSIQKLILAKHHYNEEVKAAEPHWTDYFSVSEPVVEDPQKTEDDNYQQIQASLNLNLLRLSSENTFNEASLQALWEHPKHSLPLLNDWLLENGVSLMEHIAKNEKLTFLFIKCLVNNTFLLANVHFEIPESSTGIRQRLDALKQVQAWMHKHGLFSEANLIKTEVPVHLFAELCNSNQRIDNNFLEIFELLLRLGANLSIPSLRDKELTHLSHYIAWQNRERLNKLIPSVFRLIDVRSTIAFGQTIAHLAAEKNNIEVLSWIRQRPVCRDLLFQASDMDIYPGTLLVDKRYNETFIAIFDENLKNKVPDLDPPNKLGFRISHRAAQLGSCDILQHFIDLQIDIDQPDKKGKTPLSLAAIHGKLEVVKLLIKNQANMFNIYPVSWSDLADGECTSKFLASLVEFKKKNDHRPWFENTQIFIPLSEYAFYYGHKDVGQFLQLQYCSSTEMKALLPYCYINSSTSAYTPWLLAYLGDVEAMKNVSLFFRSLNYLDIDNFGLAHYAAQGGYKEVFEWIYGDTELRALLSQQSLNGITPAFISAECNHHVLLTLLRDWGYDINVPTLFFGMKPVHIAALRSNLNSLKIFELPGLLTEPIEMEGYKGITALMLATLTGELRTITYLASFNSERKASVTLDNFMKLYKTIKPNVSSLNIKSIEQKFKARLKESGCQDDAALSLNAYQMAVMLGNHQVATLLKSKSPNDDPNLMQSEKKAILENARFFLKNQKKLHKQEQSERQNKLK